MSFIVTLIALLIERFFDWSHLRRFRWFSTLQNMLQKRLASASPYLMMALALLPPLLIAALLAYLLQGVLYGFLTLLFELAVLIYCLGPRNLWADAFASINALEHGNAHLAAEKFDVAPEFAAHDEALTVLPQRLFIAANRRVFAVIFWYALLGPIAALLYRLITLMAANVTGSSATMRIANVVEGVLDWLPVRLLTFLFALGGHFSKVLALWRKTAVHGIEANDAMLIECGMAALSNGELASPTVLDKAAMSLLDRVFIIMLVLIAIGVLLS